jgi:hypothetical protein
MIFAHIRRAARNFATSWKTLLWPLKKNARRGANSSTDRPGVDRRLHVGDPVGERERDLLDRRAALLAEVVAGDRDRVPAGTRSWQYANRSVVRRIAGSGG